MATKKRAKPARQAAPLEGLVAAAILQIQQLGAADETSRLFPDGLESIDVDLDSGNGGGRVSLRLKARQSSAAAMMTSASSNNDVRIMLEGDVEATFNAEGHHVVALIAQADLQQRLPNTMAKVQKILDDGGRDLLPAATFPDDIRNQHPETKPFHFVDIPFKSGGPANPPLPAAPHVITKIADFTATLKHGGTAQNLIDPLSWLIHLIGDIHQPLHCITHITSLHPGPVGDRGGNSFLLKGNPGNLHSLWDSSVSFTSQSEQQIAASILQEHSRQELATDLAVKDVEKWARDSFSLAKKFGYAPLVENPKSHPKPSAAYMANAQKVGRRQAALAGYRLADRLHDIFG
jgi:hypothetical protein